MKRVIDCHTHIQTKELIKEYFTKRKNINGKERCDNYAICIQGLDFLIGNGDGFYKAVKGNKNIFICECIDAFSSVSIADQLKRIEKDLRKYQTVGIKVYSGYQKVSADDPKLIPVYEFCERYNLSVVFHCGVGAGGFRSKFSMKHASSIPIGLTAKKYPKVNFIVSHFDEPNFDDCLKVITENSNVFTDISGTYENCECRPYDELIREYVSNITPHLNRYNKVKVAKKVMFGTDYFGDGSGFEAIEEYIKTLEILFGKRYEKKFLYGNCLNAYPKIKEYLKNGNE